MIKNIKSLWKQLRCPHTRTIKYYPVNDSVDWRSFGKSMGKIRGVLFEGCLNCYKVSVRNYME
jgi:hypothetical protein